MKTRSKPKSKTPPPRCAPARGSGWRRLRSDQAIEAGDRVMYSGGEISKRNVSNFEVGMTVANSGYFGIVRKRATPNKDSTTPVA